MTDAENKRLNGLIPEARAAFIQLSDMCRARGLLLFLGQTLRSMPEQQKKLDAGLTTQAVTWHFIGRGLDVYVIDPKTGAPDLAGKRVDLYQIMHEEAAKLRLTGKAFNADGSRRYLTVVKNGAKGKLWDAAHLEWRHGYDTLAEAIKAEGPAFGIG